MSGDGDSRSDTQADLRNIASDERFLRLLGPNAGACVIEIWILQIVSRETVDTRLLYGRVSPSDFTNSRWSAPEEDQFKLLAPSLSAQCLRVSAFCTSTEMLSLLEALLAGESLSTASRTSATDMTAAFDARFGALTLSAPPRIRPPMHLPTRDYFRFATDRVSPVGSCSADSAAVTSLSKSDLFVVDGDDNRVLARFAIERLDTDTGMEFANLDAWRLGDLELLVLPGLTETGASIVHVDGIFAQLEVTVDRALAAHDSEFRVRVRFFNDGALLHTVARAIRAGTTYPLTLQVGAPTHLSKLCDAYVLEIEAYKGETGECWLCFQSGQFRVREVNQRAHMSGTKSLLKSDWLAKALRASHASRLEAAQEISRDTHVTESVMGRNDSDPWVTVNRNMVGKARMLLPKRSPGRFFLRYSEGENTGRLELAEWIKSLLAEHRHNQIAWFDPYMEDMGIHLLNQYGSETGDYIVFTGTGRPDPTPWWEHIYGWVNAEAPEVDGLDSRIDKMQSACRHWSSRYGTVRLRVYGLPQTDLHDRMVLVRDNQMRPVAGYHLSNSLQYANENHPLLITPIPADILHAVIEYVDELMYRGESTRKDGRRSEPRLRCLFDSQEHEGPVDSTYIRRNVFDTPRLGEVMDWWLSTSSFYSLTGNALQRAVGARGLLRSGRFRNKVFDELPAKFWVDGLDLPEFETAWDALVSLVANSAAGTSIPQEPGLPSPRLPKMLVAYLNSNRRLTAEEVNRRGIVDVTELLQRDLARFTNQSQDPQQLFLYSRAEVSYGDYYAFKVLWLTAPSALTLWIEEGAQEQFRKDLRRQLGLKCAIRHIADQTGWGSTNDQLECLLTSRAGLLRWIGYVAFDHLLQRDAAVLVPAGPLSSLPAAEHTELLAWLLARATRRNTATRPLLIDELLRQLPGSVQSDVLAQLVGSMRNNLGEICERSPWILRDVLAPLIEQGRVDVKAVALLWFEELAKMWARSGPNDFVSFEREREGYFTDEVASLCAAVSEDVAKSIRKRVDTILRAQLRVVQTPFGAQAEWSAFDRSFRRILWIAGFLRAWLRRVPLPSRIEEGLLTAERALERRSTAEWARSNVKDLLQYRQSQMDDISDD